MIRSLPAARLAAAVGLAALGPTPAPAAPAPGSLPPGLVWVARMPGARSDALFQVGPSGKVTRSDLDYAVNAIGCAPDRMVYGLATARRGIRWHGGPHLVRIDEAGAVADLGHVDPGGLRYPLAAGYGATVLSAGGSLVLLVKAADTQLWVRISPGAPMVLRSRPLPALPSFGDWDADADGDLYAVVYAGHTEQLVRLDHATQATTLTPLPGLPANSGYGGIALGADRVLYAVDNRTAGNSILYRVPVDRPADAVRLRELGPAISSDAALCVPPPSVAPTSAPRPFQPHLPAIRPDASPRRVASPAAAPRRPSPPRRRPAAKSPVRTRGPDLRLIPVLAGAVAAVSIAIRLTRGGARS